MDARQFDSLTKRLTHLRSRRGLLAAGALATLGLSAGDNAGAKKKKPCPPCKKRKKGKCKATLPDGTACEAGGTCQGGSCVRAATDASTSDPVSPPPPSCLQGQRLCRGACLSVLICCEDGDCAGGRTCQQGTCACPPAKPKLCSGSTVCQECCTTDDCRESPQGNVAAVCSNNQCFCDPSTRRCPSGSSWPGYCGKCCSDTDCPAAEICLLPIDASGVPTAPPECRCFSGTTCNDICIPFECASKCNQPCDNPGGFCCSGKGALFCEPQQNGTNKCVP